MLCLKKIVNSMYWIIITFSIYYILSFLSIQAIEEKNKFLVEDKCKGCHPVRLDTPKNGKVQL
ncbi:hypothetical protein HY745_02185 [Candidatus Desantisbacteria bacterium]|nr:hypothetical protein [Candidatus Desantisbacteria bacterium]